MSCRDPCLGDLYRVMWDIVANTYTARALHFLDDGELFIVVERDDRLLTLSAQSGLCCLRHADFKSYFDQGTIKFVSKENSVK